MKVKILPNQNGNPAGKLADAELHFNDGALEGMKLIGFAIWERRSGGGRNVTFPARASTSSMVTVAAFRCCGQSLTPTLRNGCGTSCSRPTRSMRRAPQRQLRS